MKKTIILLSVLVVGICCKAQQVPHYTHYMFNQAGYNPAYCGLEGIINATLVYRNQWAGLEGSPKTMMLTADMPINLLGRQSGVGLTLEKDDIGFEKNFTAKGAYSYHIPLGGGVFSVGVDAGIFNKTIDGDWQFPDEPEMIFQGKTRKMIFDVGAGLFYMRKGLSVGLSSTHVTEPVLDFSEDGETFLSRHYYFLTKYNIPLTNSLLDLTPSLILLSDGNNLEFDININILYNKKVWGGVTYRNGDAISILGGLVLMGDLKIGLAYDLGISKLRKTNTGSFELMLNYGFMPEKSKPAQRVRSVRFL